MKDLKFPCVYRGIRRVEKLFGIIAIVSDQYDKYK